MDWCVYPFLYTLLKICNDYNSINKNIPWNRIRTNTTLIPIVALLEGEGDQKRFNIVCFYLFYILQMGPVARVMAKVCVSHAIYLYEAVYTARTIFLSNIIRRKIHPLKEHITHTHCRIFHPFSICFFFIHIHRHIVQYIYRGTRIYIVFFHF